MSATTEQHSNQHSDLEWLPTDSEGRRLPRVEVKFHSDGKSYAYAWGGRGTLRIGDIVVVPRPPEWEGPHVGYAHVVKLGSGYEGPVRTIISRAEGVL
jgi:hypothetical protein